MQTVSLSLFRFDSIAARFYHAAGWFAPCDSVVYVKRSLLKLVRGRRRLGRCTFKIKSSSMA